MEDKIVFSQASEIQNNWQNSQKQHQESFCALNRRRSRQQKKTQKFIRNFWVLEEDNKLRQLVQKYGVKKWTQISSHMSGRPAKRCRQRWMNYLDSAKVKTAKWSEHQKWMLYLCYVIHGNKWSAIATILNRGDNIVKNQINSLRRKRMFPFEGKLKHILTQPSKYLESQEPTQQECQLLKQIINLQGLHVHINIKQDVLSEKVQCNPVKKQQNQVKHNGENIVKIEEQEQHINASQESDRRSPQLQIYSCNETQIQPFWWHYPFNYPLPVQYGQYQQFLAVLNGMNEVQLMNSCFMDSYN